VKGDVVITNWNNPAHIGYYPPIVDFSGIEEITGSLSCTKNQFMGKLFLTNLKSVGSLELVDIPLLSMLDLRNLTTAGSMRLENLTSLSAFPLGTNNAIATTPVIRIHNTSIEAFEGLNQDSIVDISLTSNENLKVADLSRLKTYGDLIIAGNNASLTVNLSNATSGGITNISNVNDMSIASLTNLTGNLTLYDNRFTNLTAPHLTTAKSVVIDGNPQLRKIQMPALRNVHGDLQVTLNEKLTSFELPNLENVTDFVGLNGTFAT
jgi:hypothetical protein